MEDAVTTTVPVTVPGVCLGPLGKEYSDGPVKITLRELKPRLAVAGGWGQGELGTII